MGAPSPDTARLLVPTNSAGLDAAPFAHPSPSPIFSKLLSASFVKLVELFACRSTTASYSGVISPVFGGAIKATPSAQKSANGRMHAQVPIIASLWSMIQLNYRQPQSPM